jgi:hypothetical protein
MFLSDFHYNSYTDSWLFVYKFAKAAKHSKRWHRGPPTDTPEIEHTEPQIRVVVALLTLLLDMLSVRNNNNTTTTSDVCLWCPKEHFIKKHIVLLMEKIKT